MRAPRPWHFFVLVVPYGVSFGFVGVALPYVARQRGVAVEAIAGVVAAAYAPHAWKFLWAPVVDSTLGRKVWYVVALALVAAGTFAMMAMPIAPGSLGVLTSVVVASQVGLTLLYMACEGTLGRAVPPEGKAAAAAWLQAGTFLGLGVGGGLSIELVSHLPGTLAGAIVAASLGACALPLLAFDEPAREARRGAARALADLLRDLWSLARTRAGVLALLVAASSIGCGAASGLFAALADDWHASRAMVELTNGWLGGIVSALGAGLGGWTMRRVRARTAFFLAGALTAATGVAMAAVPHVPWSYAALNLVYQTFTGMAYAGFAALAYETIGKGAVATKYNVLASIMNGSIVYKTRLLGRADARWGASGVLYVDAAVTAAAIVALLVVTAVLTREKGSPSR